MSQEWPGSLVCGVFRKSYKLLRSHSNHSNVCHSTVFVTQRSSSLFICVCSNRSLYLLYHPLISRVVRVRFFWSSGLYNSLCVLGCCCWSVALSKIGEDFWFYISPFFGCVIPLCSVIFVLFGVLRLHGACVGDPVYNPELQNRTRTTREIKV